MIHIFKVPGKKVAFDSESGALVTLNSLTNKMLGALTPPLGETMPTSLRYELAKYDSEDVSDAYDYLFSLSERGILFAEETDEKKLMLEGEFAAESEDEIRMAMQAVKNAGGSEIILLGKSSLSECAEEIKRNIFG